MEQNYGGEKWEEWILFEKFQSGLIINMCNMYVSKCKHNAWQDWQESEQREQGRNNFTIVLDLSR